MGGVTVRGGDVTAKEERERGGQRREIGKCYASGLKEEEGATSQGILVALENLNKAREDTLS